jgi:hypothetical protein
MSSATPQATRRGFPLAVLFVLVTGSAALIAGIAPAVQHIFKDQVGLEPLLWALIGGGAGGLLLGLIIGILQHGWRLGTPIGTVTGLSLGIVAGLLALSPTSQLPRVAVALVVGCGLMIGVAIFMRQKR